MKNCQFHYIPNDRHRRGDRTDNSYGCDLFVESFVEPARRFFTTRLHNLYYRAFVNPKIFRQDVDFDDRHSTYCWNSELLITTKEGTKR